jgi:hypothetical protein
LYPWCRHGDEYRQKNKSKGARTKRKAAVYRLLTGTKVGRDAIGACARHGLVRSHNTQEDLNMTNGEELSHTEELAGHGEPWEPWETQLVLWSIGLGVAGLVVLGVLVNAFILP